MNNYYKKYLKYKEKYSQLKNTSIIGGFLGRELELEIYSDKKVETLDEQKLVQNTVKKGGYSDNIWPIISNEWKKNNNLSFRSSIDPTVNFSVVENHSDLNDLPILGRGTYTAVYEVKNKDNLKDKTPYILRLYLRDLDISSKHLLKTKKIFDEYKKYNKYLIAVHYFGQVKFKSNSFEYIENEDDSKLDNYVINKDEITNYTFDYIITQKYKTPSFNDDYVVNNLTNQQKFLFLKNNLKLLKELQENNTFHTDYKIENVGWDDDTKMNIIMVDYDESTLQIADESNKNFIMEDGDLTEYNFYSTYKPKYLLIDAEEEGGKPTINYKDFNPDTYIKFSVGGLINIINCLEIKFTQTSIKLSEELVEKLAKRKIKRINTENLSTSLHLDGLKYDLIPRYSEILKILDFLEPYLQA